MIDFEAVAVPMDRVLATLIAGLECEFGRGAGEGLAQQFLAAEDVDFRWGARREERWLGAYEAQDEGEFWLDRIAICGQLDRQWFAAVMLVDGDGNAHGMLGCRAFQTEHGALEAFRTTH